MNEPELAVQLLVPQYQTNPFRPSGYSIRRPEQTPMYMPANGGPQDAQRVGVRMGGGTRELASQSAPGHGGLTFGQKAAIGAGTAALFGCYELGCFSRKPTTYAPQ